MLLSWTCMYPIASVYLGVSASPPYWAFIDPASLLNTLFFVAAANLLLWNVTQFAECLKDIDGCPSPATA